MQAIARANRISQGKNNGLIVDYIETYKSLLEVLAIYGSSGAGGPDAPPEPPVKPKEALIGELEEALAATETFLREEVDFALEALINSPGLEKLAALDRAIDAVYTNDETKRKFQVLAREVFRKFKALQPDKALNAYAPRKNAIDAIYSAIENNVQSADVADLMRRIHDVINASIENKVAEARPETNHAIDLSGLDFGTLEKYFQKMPHQYAAVQSLKERVEQRLQRMVARNPLRVDFYERYQEIIDAYNRGKDSVTIQETFRQLIEFVNSLTEEEADTRREGLTEEQKAIFDILRHGKELSTPKKNAIKKIVVELLDALKEEKLPVELWADKAATAAAVFNLVNKTLFEALPYPTYQTDDIDLKTNLVYPHLRQQFHGSGASVNGRY